jgi:hypothetical protein
MMGMKNGLLDGLEAVLSFGLDRLVTASAPKADKSLSSMLFRAPVENIALGVDAAPTLRTES